VFSGTEATYWLIRGGAGLWAVAMLQVPQIVALVVSSRSPTLYRSPAIPMFPDFFQVEAMYACFTCTTTGVHCCDRLPFRYSSTYRSMDLIHLIWAIMTSYSDSRQSISSSRALSEASLICAESISWVSCRKAMNLSSEIWWVLTLGHVVTSVISITSLSNVRSPLIITYLIS
jgi:hypothetical protein